MWETYIAYSFVFMLQSKDAPAHKLISERKENNLDCSQSNAIARWAVWFADERKHPSRKVSTLLLKKYFILTVTLQLSLSFACEWVSVCCGWNPGALLVVSSRHRPWGTKEASRAQGVLWQALDSLSPVTPPGHMWLNPLILLNKNSGVKHPWCSNFRHFFFFFLL